MQAPGEDLIGRLWDTIANKGIGSLLKPWQMKREGRAALDIKREEMLALAQAERDADLIKRGDLTFEQAQGKRDSMHVEAPRVEPRLDPGSLRQIAAEIVVDDVIRREVNITKALLHAEDELEGDDQAPPEQKVSDDWLYRWRDNASQVSTEELQSLWGRLLAGEVKAPGSFSLRTLEFLKNLSHSEATNIVKLASLDTQGWIFKGEGDFLTKFGLSFDLLLELQHLGVVAGVDAIGLSITMVALPFPPHTVSVRSNGWVLVGETSEPNKQCSLPMIQITPLGRQVLSLCKGEPQLDYLRQLGASIKAQGFAVKLAQYVDISATQFQYMNAQTL